MNKKDKIRSKNEEEPVELSSSPCSINDVNPDYMGLSGFKKNPNSETKKQNKPD